MYVYVCTGGVEAVAGFVVGNLSMGVITFMLRLSSLCMAV